MKKITAYILTFALVLTFTVVSVMAENKEIEHSERQVNLVEDFAGMLTSEEDLALEEKLSEISVRNKCEVAIRTVPSLSKVGDYHSIQAAADDIYDYDGYGYGEKKDGLLLLITPRQRHITTYGFAQKAFNDDVLKYMAKELRPIFEKGDNYKAMDKFADETDRALKKARNGKPYNSWTIKPLPLRLLITFGISLILGLIFASLVLIRMKGKMKTVRFQGQADYYLDDGSIEVTRSEDHFTGSNISSVKKVKIEDGGGTHVSSSGRSHGGISF